jgi:hypothetical protein
MVMRPPIVRDERPCYPRRFRLAFGGRYFFNGLASLELPSIGWQLFVLGSSQSDSTAFSSLLDTYATRLLTEPLTDRLALVLAIEAPRPLAEWHDLRRRMARSQEAHALPIARQSARVPSLRPLPVSSPSSLLSSLIRTFTN